MYLESPLRVSIVDTSILCLFNDSKKYLWNDFISRRYRNTKYICYLFVAFQLLYLT